MQAHRIAPFSGALCVAIVTRDVLFLGVEIVPVDIVPPVCVPFANKVLSSRCGSTIAIISSLSRWLRGTSHRCSTPKREWRYRCSYCWSASLYWTRNSVRSLLYLCKDTAEQINQIKKLLWTYFWWETDDVKRNVVIIFSFEIRNCWNCCCLCVDTSQGASELVVALSKN